MTITDALAIARSTRREIHALGYASSDDAIERAASVLADEVEAYQHMACDECEWQVFDGNNESAYCRKLRKGTMARCALFGNGCKGFDPRVSE